MGRLGELPDGVRDMVFSQLPTDRLAQAARAGNSNVWRTRTSPVEACMRRLAKLLEYLRFERNGPQTARHMSVVLVGLTGGETPLEAAADVDYAPILPGMPHCAYAIKARPDGYTVQSLGNGYPSRPMTTAAVLDWCAAGPALRLPRLDIVFSPASQQAWSLTFLPQSYEPVGGALQLRDMLSA